MALRLFLHAFQTIFGNFGQAFQASVVPFAALAAVAFGMLFISGGNVGVVVVLLIFIGFFFVFGFVAASWHRFVLLEEQPRLNGPAANRAFPYIGKTILLGLWLLLLLIPVLLVMVLVGAPFLGQDQFIGTGAPDYGFDDMLFELVFGTIGGSIILLYSLVLPASALGKSMTFRDSRVAASSLGTNLVVLAFLIAAFNAVCSLAIMTVVGGTGVIAVGVSLALQWLVMMVGISILTTLYGHLVEGRDLPT